MNQENSKPAVDAPKPRRRPVRWTRKMKDDFLDHLAATCNVRGAAREVGVHPRSVYNLRRKDPAFTRAWGEALLLGYEVLETRLVGCALAGAREDGAPCVPDADRPEMDEPVEPLDRALALHLLKSHRGHLLGRRAVGGPKPRRATPEETDAAILRKLAAMDRRRQARDEAEA
ncbi:hypothetical protein [Sphingomonas lenta]|uniref:Terminase n=1 Tax=Sphingomonas lenta TaxID=1141887 RepID=A0A2A2SCT0_9SPHN|nr:hypothetical protein [Sphingomonas lenta]PAX07000.1 hypothetical protein CKY28_13120 [Sphingomonas lenta]